MKGGYKVPPIAQSLGFWCAVAFESTHSWKLAVSIEKQDGIDLRIDM
jgi:hypothetical protein